MQFQNMGPFKPSNFKGNAAINGVPTFVDKLPLTIGGIAGEDLFFGRVVSIDPTVNRRNFVAGTTTGNIIKGIVMLDPTIMRTDPAMNNYYFAGRPVTVITFGLVDILEYDVTQDAPMEGSTVWCRNDNGMLAFNDGTDISASGYTRLKAFVYESLDPNGAKVFFGMDPIASQTRETTVAATVPVATPAAGAVAVGTEVKLTSATTGAIIKYTLDGEEPSATSPVYQGPITVTSAVTIKAIALAEGKDPSTVLTAAYTIA